MTELKLTLDKEFKKLVDEHRRIGQVHAENQVELLLAQVSLHKANNETEIRRLAAKLDDGLKLNAEIETKMKLIESCMTAQAIRGNPEWKVEDGES